MPNQALPHRASLVGPPRPVFCDAEPEVLVRYLDALGDWDVTQRAAAAQGERGQADGA